MSHAFSSDPKNFASRKDYVKLLQKGLDKVQPLPSTHDFLFFPKHTFAGSNKTEPLLLVDFDPKLPAVLKAAKLEPTVAGVVSLTANKELDFRMDKGAVPLSTLAAELKKFSVSQPVFMGAAKPATPAAQDDASPAATPPGTAAAQPAAASAGTPPAPKPQPQPQPMQQAKPALASTAAAANPSPNPNPARQPAKPPEDLLDLYNAMQKATFEAEWQARKPETLEKVRRLIKAGEYDNARKVLDALGTKRLSAQATAALPAAALDGLDEAGGDTAPWSADEKAFREAALSPASAVAGAQQRLLEEEAAFERRKTARKAEKIGASYSNEAKALQEAEAKAVRKAAEPHKSAGDKVLAVGSKVGHAVTFNQFKDKPARDPKDPNRIDDAHDNKKADDELKKVDQVFKAGGTAGTLDYAIAKGLGSALDPANTGDDIASAAGSVAASTAAAASSLLDVGRELRLWHATKGAERSVHLDKAATALGAVAGNLVNISKGSVNIAQNAKAVEAGATVPILGIVAAVPSLIFEINQLRSAIHRVAKQEKVHARLEKAIEGGDTSQATLYTLVGGFIERDGENIGKGVARVSLDLTKVAGHGVAAGGITGPIGVALVGVGTAGKLLISAAESAKGLADAHKANDRRKKLQPTLHAGRDWDALAKDKPADPVTKEVTAAIAALAQAEKGTPAHAAAIDRLDVAAAAYAKANAGSKKATEFTTKLRADAAEEKAAWDSADESADPLKQKKGHALTPQEGQHRNARKLMAGDPRLAAQTLLEQAIREGEPGGPAFAVLQSFGIKASQVYGGPKDGDDRIASNREMRQKILYKLGADDETALTASQSMNETKGTVKDYFSMRSKHQELDAYMEAKNLLRHGGEAKRGKGWQLKMDLLTDDVEEKKATLLAHVLHLEAQQDIEPGVVAQVKRLLAPREEKKRREAMAGAGSGEGESQRSPWSMPCRGQTQVVAASALVMCAA